ncbi:hypothetical protein BGW38_008190, partial [Lunasporangiospora selenospora]
FEVVITPNRANGGLVAEEIKIPWLVNEKTATLDELWTIIFRNWSFCSDYKQSDLKMVLEDKESGPTAPTPLNSNEDVRRSLRDAIQSKNTKIFIGLEIAPKSFAKWSFKDVCRSFGFSTVDEPGIDVLPPFDDIQQTQLDSCQTEILDDLIKEIMMKKEVLELNSANEATKSHMVFSYLAAATYVFKKDLYLASQQHLTGSRGKGSTDFSVISRRDKYLTLGVTE